MVVTRFKNFWWICVCHRLMMIRALEIPAWLAFIRSWHKGVLCWMSMRPSPSLLFLSSHTGIHTSQASLFGPPCVTFKYVKCLWVCFAPRFRVVVFPGSRRWRRLNWAGVVSVVWRHKPKQGLYYSTWLRALSRKITNLFAAPFSPNKYNLHRIFIIEFTARVGLCFEIMRWSDSTIGVSAR